MNESSRASLLRSSSEVERWLFLLSSLSSSLSDSTFNRETLTSFWRCSILARHCRLLDCRCESALWFCLMALASSIHFWSSSLSLLLFSVSGISGSPKTCWNSCRVSCILSTNSDHSCANSTSTSSKSCCISHCCCKNSSSSSACPNLSCATTSYWSQAPLRVLYRCLVRSVSERVFANCWRVVCAEVVSEGNW